MKKQQLKCKNHQFSSKTK